MPTQNTKQNQEITVERGYHPGTVVISEGQSARLTFTRKERGSCSRELLFPWAGIRRALPLDAPVTIDLPPLAAGDYEYTCGMNMLRGRISVRPENE